MKLKPALTLLHITLTLWLLASCSQAAPAPTPTIQPPPTDTPTDTATLTPVSTDTPTPAPTSTSTPSPSPTMTSEPLLVIQVVDEENGETLPGATVKLTHSRLQFDASQTTNADGQATFDDVQASRWAYETVVTAQGYHDIRDKITVEPGENNLTINLTPRVLALVTSESANLRSGPGDVYDVVGAVNQDAILPVVGQSEDGEWLVVETAKGETAWLSGTLVDVEGELSRVTTLASPPTPSPTMTMTPEPTFTPTPPPAVAVAPAPPPAAPPSGDNLLVNPGFEHGPVGWTLRNGGTPWLYSISDYAQFIHSGDKALVYGAYQYIDNVTPGVTYRFGAWARTWSSPDEDRTVSKNPGNIAMLVCINVAGEDVVGLETTICSGGGNPLDTWQYYSIDAIATSTRIVVFLHIQAPMAPRHNEGFWDDAFLSVAPVAATPTPPPAPAPTRPDPIPFGGVALRDSMAHLQWVIEQMGGLLDRVYSGQAGSCSEYLDYYAQTIQIATYHSIPDEWQGVYNEYVWSADNVLATNEQIYLLCQSGGGKVSQLNYGLARSGIHDTLPRLIPAIATANALLGQ